MFGRSIISFQPLKNLAEIASEGYQDLVNCYFRLNPNGDGKNDTEVIKTLGFTQSGTNTSLPAAKRGLAIKGFTPSVGSAGGVYAVWDRSSGTESDVYKLGASDPTAQGISAYLPTQDTDGEFEQVNDNLYYTNGVDAIVKLTGSTGVWSQMASGAPYSSNVAKYLAWHNYMLFAARTVAAPNILYYSDAGVDTFTGGNTKTFRHAIVGLKPLGDYLMVYTTNEIHAITGNTPSTLSYRQLINAHPCVSHRSIVQVTGDNGAIEHWYLGADYVWATNGSGFRILGHDSWENFRSSLSTAYLGVAAATYNDVTNQYELSVPTGSNTSNTVTWAYDAIADKWIEKPLQTASCYTKYGAPTPSLYFLDSQATGKAYLKNSGYGIQSLKTTISGSATGTLGYTSIGGSSASTANYIGSKFTASETGTVSSIVAYTAAAAGTVNIDVAIYSDSSGYPATKLATGTSTVSVNTTPQWVTVPITYTITAGQTYWIYFWASGSRSVYWDAGSTNQYESNGGTFNTWPATESGGTFFDRKLSIYANYTTDASTTTTLNVASTTGFPTSGVLQIESEAISYTGVTATTFTGCGRGYQGTTAATHVNTTAVYPAMQFRYRTKYMDFNLPNMIKKFQILWVNTKVSTTPYSLSVNVDVDQSGYSLAKNIPLQTTGMIWGSSIWGAATWGAQSVILTPTNRAPLVGRGKAVKISLDEATSIQQTEITEAELRFRPLKRK